MIRSGFQLHQMRRMTAWLLILVCAWMGTGGVLHHTDEGTFSPPGLYSAGSPSTGSVHRQTAAAPTDTCAACEWTQGLQGQTLAVYHVLTPLILLRPRSIVLIAAPTRRALFLRSPRAPPVFLLNG